METTNSSALDPLSPGHDYHQCLQTQQLLTSQMRLQTPELSTCSVQLSLLQLGLIYDQGGVAGQLQQPADQAVGRVVLVRDEARVVHALDAHAQVVGLQGHTNHQHQGILLLQLQLGWEPAQQSKTWHCNALSQISKCCVFQNFPKENIAVRNSYLSPVLHI